MTSAEATGSGYYYGLRQVDDSPGGFGYHRSRSQPILLQPVTDRTSRDVTNWYADVGWHHHRNLPQRQAASVDVFGQQQQRGDVVKFFGGWTPIVRDQRSPDDQGRPYRNHYGYHERATDVDVERRPLKDDRPKTIVANGSQTTVRSVDENELLQWAAGERNERYPATVRTCPGNAGNAGEGTTLARRAPNLQYPGFEIVADRFGANDNCSYPRADADVGEKNDNRPGPEESGRDSHTRDWKSANDNRSRIAGTADHQVMVRPNLGNEMGSSLRYRNATAATDVGDKNGTDGRREQHVYLEKFAAVTAAATRQTDDDGETGKPPANGVGREDFDRTVVDGLSAVTIAVAADEPDYGRRAVTIAVAADVSGNDLDGHAPSEKTEPRDGRRRWPSTALATDPTTTAVPERPSDVTVPRQRRRKIQSSTLPSPPRPLVKDIRTMDDGGGGQNNFGRKRNNHNGQSVHHRYYVTTGSGNDLATTATALQSMERKERGDDVAGDEPQQEHLSSYSFRYAVTDEQKGIAFDQWERRKSGRPSTVSGQYRVRLPDGRTQKVVYTADADTGYKASVTYEGVQRFPTSSPPQSSDRYDTDAPEMLTD